MYTASVTGFAFTPIAIRIGASDAGLGFFPKENYIYIYLVPKRNQDLNASGCLGFPSGNLAHYIQTQKILFMKQSKKGSPEHGNFCPT
jgi:hypothetical protein